MPDWPPLHDYSHSVAVVMGTSDFVNLQPLPAAAHSTDRMAALLMDPLCGWPHDRVKVLLNERTPADLPLELVKAFRDATDVALFYYVGHGQIDLDNQLCLGLTGTSIEPDLRSVTSLQFEAVRRAMLSSAAKTKIVILDCCFSGLAANGNTLAGNTDDILDRAAGTGAYTMAASTPYGLAQFESETDGSRPQTIFTKYFADLVEAGIPGVGPWLTLHQIFSQLREYLARDRLPIPVARNVDSAGEFAFAHNAMSDVAIEDPSITPGAERPLPEVSGRPLPEVCSDAPSATDMIGAAADVEILADLIAATDTSPPLAIALIGDWGAGKSSVMLQIQNRVELLAEISLSNAGQSAFAANIRQVMFNAWDYSDEQLWCGLIEHLFSVLASSTGDPVDVPDATAAQADRIALHRKLAEQQAAERRLSDALDAADRVAQPQGFLSNLGSPVYVLRIMRAAGRELSHDIRAATVVLLFWAILGVAAYEVWSRWGPFIGALAASLAAVIAPAAAIGQRLWRWHGSSVSAAQRLRSRLDEQRRQASEQVADLRERLALIDASVRLSAFLSNRSAPRAYQEHRGLLGQVRSDLAKLSDDLAAARSEWAEAGRVGAPPLERVVLYIDDLDRCPPKRVVEVLEAVHLMLAFELFVVVVAVDARWLIRSLEYHYRELFSIASGQETRLASSTEPALNSDPASPADYLDKIFQIPYMLAPSTPAALGSFLRSLLPSGIVGAPPVTAVRTGLPDATPTNAPTPEQTDLVDQNGQRIVAHTPEPGSAGPNLHPQRLRLSQREIDFMGRLGPLIPTPRAAKRLVNLYRLIRISVPNADLQSFTGSDSGGQYQIVQILLAILVGKPAAASRIFMELMCAPADSDILVILEKASLSGLDEAPFCATISSQLARISQEIPLVISIKGYQQWCPTLARYSFHTRTIIPEKPVSE